MGSNPKCTENGGLPPTLMGSCSVTAHQLQYLLPLRAAWRGVGGKQPLALVCTSLGLVPLCRRIPPDDKIWLLLWQEEPNPGSHTEVRSYQLPLL